MEREPLRGALPDAGQARKLGDQTVDRRCKQTAERTSGVGRSISGTDASSVAAGS
jgi:hypothetical protein